MDEHGDKLQTKDQQIAVSIEAVLPGWKPEAILYRNDRTLLFRGRCDGLAVVVKKSIALDPLHQRAFERELDNLETFMRVIPPFRTPQVLAVDRAARLALLEFIPGEALGAGRVFEADLSAGTINSLFTCLEAISRFSDPVSSDTRERLTQRYLERARAYESMAILTGKDLAVVQQVLSDVEARPVFQHGDCFPGNFIADSRGLWCVDWEMASGFLPFYDLAFLWCGALKSALLQSAIEQRLRKGFSGSELAFFWLNALLIAAREYRIQRDGPDVPGVENCRALLEQKMTLARLHLQ